MLGITTHCSNTPWMAKKWWKNSRTRMFDVGDIIATNLKPSEQCVKAAKKVNQVLGQLSRAVKYRGRMFAQLYTIYVRCHMEYSFQSWRPWTDTDKKL